MDELMAEQMKLVMWSFLDLLIAAKERDFLDS